MRRELEDQAARVQDLEEMIGIVEKNKREVEQHLAVEIKDKDEEIQKLQGQVQNNALLSAELRKLLEKNEKQLADLKKNVEELEDVLNNKVAEIEDLTDALTEKEREIIRLTEVLAEEKKQTVRQLKRQLDELLKKIKTQERQMKDLVEKIQLKEAENAFYKQDFESERTDRQRIHAKYEELKIKTEEERLQHKADKDAMANLTEELQKHEEWIQVLTAQVNAYSREVDRQKGIVTQSQEKHKTEVNELVERLASGTKSKEQLDNELTRMRQQLDNVSADKEELLRAYHQERAKLEDQIDKLKKANIVLKDKLLASIKSPSELSRLHEVERQLSSKQEEVISLQKILSGFQNTWELSHREVSLLEELGRGGYGVVWVGQLRVAVKKLHEWIVSQHNMETFHHEINIMSQLRHPNLLQFIGAVLDHPSGCPMIVTEVMDTSLRKAYENKELTPDPGCRPVILSIMCDVAEGLNYLHCLPDPIIHRDVSSANVLLQSIAGPRKWKGKISDFGSAKLAKKAITEGPGAFAYSAPEAFQNMANPDPTKKQTTKMDVFSYGVLLCEIIICRFPDNIDIFQDMLHQVHSISDRPSGTRDTQGSLLHSLIVSCCHDDPSRRPTMK
ncbi:PREDICTED: probable serine/threonine-protein kinase drkD, partial [Amphimedon queenslandica]|uniref:Protein kinase domain-containing protein n=2 Tax=Amphimedon queenslandica TaxID=400682 RepID=A0AAN0ITI9_AMPQE